MIQFPIGDYNIACYESGAGQPVLLLHCSSASHRMWLPLLASIESHFHCIAPDFSGYGDSDDISRTWPVDTLPDLDMVLALLDSLSTPVHLIGHSYGGAIALEAARARPQRVRAMTLVEPVAFHLLEGDRDTKSAREAKSMMRTLVKRAERHQFAAAARHYMSYWSSPLSWWLMPGDARAKITSSMHKVAAECRYMKQFAPVDDSLNALTMPVTLLQGSKTRRTATRIIDILLEHLPDSRVIHLRDAGHLSPFTHTKMVNRILESTL